MSDDDAILRALTYLADRIEGEVSPDQRAQLAGVPPDAALDVAAAVLVGLMKGHTPGPSRPFVAGVVRGMAMRAWFDLEVEQ